METNLQANFKNIVIGSQLTAGGDIHIGDKIYQVGEDFKHSILFLRITPEGASFSADLNLKTKHPHLKAQAADMLHQKIDLQIPPDLFNQVDRFQQQRRSIENARLQSPAWSPAAAESQISQLLYQHFFAGDIGTVLRNFIAALQAHKIEELLLVISSPDTRIRNLPWEMVLDRLCPDSVLGMQGFGLVRSGEQEMEGFDMTARAAQPSPLKLLFVTALPENLSEDGKRLELEDEQQKLIQAVGHLEATGDKQPKMVIEFLDVASVGEIEKALRARDHDVLHISGHGGWLKEMQQGILYLEDDLGDRKDTPSQELADVLRGLKHIKLVVLSACETAVAGEAGTADVIAASGVPAVLAMRFSVSDQGAKVFTTAFYEKLVQGNTVTESMTTGRLALAAHHAARVEQYQAAGHPKEAVPAEWFTPVLYLNQYVENLVNPNPRDYHFPDQFYTHSIFLKESHTKLIGGGFIGRKRQRIAMRHAFHEGEHICLVGMGGMGKTTLAEAFARNYNVGSHRLIIWRGDKEITELGILTRIMEHFKEWQPNSSLHSRLKGIVEDGQVPILKRLDYLIKNCLAGEKSILIFDNFEDLQWQEGDADQRIIVDDGIREMLIHLLVNLPKNSHILFTTRYRIEGLPSDKIHFLDLDKLSEAEEYRLMNMSNSLRWIGAEDREKIYKRLDGLPRAYTYLEGLARHDAKFSWTDLENSLADVQGKVFADLMLGKIYGLLNADLQQTFLVASVFFTRTPIWILVKVLENRNSGDKLKTQLQNLSKWGLCFCDLEGEEFEVHNLTRSWIASQHLIDDEDIKRFAEQIGQVFANQEYFNPQANDSEIENQKEIYFAMFKLAESKYVAAKYFATAFNWDEFAHSQFWVQAYAQQRGNFGFSEAICKEILEKPVSIKHRIQALNEIGVIETNKGNYQFAISRFREGLKLEGEGKEFLKIRARSLINLASIHDKMGDFDNAILWLGEALQISRRIFDRSYEATILNNLALIHNSLNQDDVALELLEESLVVLDVENDIFNAAVTKCNIATMFLKLGKAEAAKAILHSALLLFELYDKKPLIAGALYSLSIVLNKIGDKVGALDVSCRSLSIQVELGLNQIQQKTLNNVGVIFYELEQFENAIPYLFNCYRFPINHDSIIAKNANNYLKYIRKKIGETRFQEILSTLYLENL